MKRRGLEGRIVVLRNKGFMFKEIAERVGISTAHATNLYRRSKLKKEDSNAK